MVKQWSKIGQTEIESGQNSGQTMVVKQADERGRAAAAHDGSNSGSAVMVKNTTQ